MQWAEVNRELLCLATQELALSRFNAVVGFFVLQADLLGIFLLVDRPMERELDGCTVLNSYGA